MSTSSSLQNSELRSTLHDRQRRQERMIGKEDQLRARRYGMCEPCRNGRLKFTYNNQVLIWCPIQNKAITCWNLKDQTQGSSRKSGTSCIDPVLIQKSSKHETGYALSAHTLVTHQIRNQKEKWTSHSVLVVDMSGSMRTDDVDGARCRSDGVWTCLARDFIQNQISQGKSSLHDLVSVVMMRDVAQVVLECEPTDFVLYNKLVDLREWTHHRPGGHGNYRPALEQAEILLDRNRLGSCALSLFFFSDGKPSDTNKQDLPANMGALASRFGRRLSITCVGMANEKTEDFTILENMVNEAKAFGAIASFNKPSMNAGSLSQIVTSSFASSLTSAKTELTSVGGKSLTVRTDLVRERRDSPDDLAPTEDWLLFNSDDRYTVNVWAWNQNIKRGAGGFSRLIDPRCAACFSVHVMDTFGACASSKKGILCKGCKTCFFCWECIKNKKAGRVHGRKQCYEQATSRRQGGFMPLSENVPSFSVAWKQKCFDEGAERVAFKFRFLDEFGHFFGPKMVAKESRFASNEGIESNAAKDYLTTQQHLYHVDFMRTQYLASKFAHKFNDTLKDWEEHLESMKNPHGGLYGEFHQRCLLHKERIRTYPRIRFLQPHIFELVDKASKRTFNVLVESMIEGEYRKYNNNNGGLVDETFESPYVQRSDTSLNPSLVEMLLGTKAEDGIFSLENNPSATLSGENLGLGAIVEEDSDDEEGDDDISHPDNFAEQHLDSGDELGVQFFETIMQEGDQTDRQLSNLIIPNEDFMQSFSHFSFVRSGGRLIVVDLQGTLDVKPDGTREYVLTDPAIHKRRKSKKLKHLKFGRTDRGDQGIHDFFQTHKCNNACRLLGLRPKEKRNTIYERQDRKF